MRILKLLIIILFVFGCNRSKEPQDDKFTALTKLMDQYAKESLKKGNINAFALAVYKDGNIYKNYYGEQDKGLGNKPTDNSLYEIASITKTFTGSLVAKAVLEGKINVEDDVRKYLDGDFSNLEFQGNPITIKNLLTHSMGLKHKSPAGFESVREKVSEGNYNSKTNEYTIHHLLKELQTAEVNKKPGTEFAYNSVGPELLAYILEKVNQKPFKTQLKDFFKEIGMHNAYLRDSYDASEDQKLLVNGYRGDKLAFKDYCPVYGAAGGAIATLPDLIAYMQFLLANKNEPWIKEAVRPLFVDPEDGEQIGYLWQHIGVGKEEGYFYSKTGTSSGVQSGILICPGSDYGLVLMANNTSDTAYRDWASLFYYDIEPDLIKYPKLNLFSTLKTEFMEDPKLAISKYDTLKKDTANYFLRTRTINNYAYRLLRAKEEEKALIIFKFITNEFPEDANAYDSLGEAYFVVEDFQNALFNYKKSLELNPKNQNAKNYIKKIEQLSLEKK